MDHGCELWTVMFPRTSLCEIAINQHRRRKLKCECLRDDVVATKAVEVRAFSRDRRTDQSRSDGHAAAVFQPKCSVEEATI